MRVSEITVAEIAAYLRLGEGEYTTTELDVLLSAAKAFISSYTGLNDISVTDKILGVGDGVTTTFYLYPANTPVVPSSQAIYIDGEVKETDFTLNEKTGKVVFTAAPPVNSIISGDYKAGMDAFEDFVPVVYILCQDMYDNRAMYVDKANINRVVETILGMHRVNLLPSSEEAVS